MTDEDVATNSPPGFIFEERGVPSDTKLPETVLGVYTFARGAANDADRAYTRRGVLTSEGWVPPAPAEIVHVLAKTGEGPNDVDALRGYAVGKSTRVVLEPRELRSNLSPEGSVHSDENLSAALRSTYRDEVSYYIPDIEPDALTQYIRECVRPAVGHYLDNHDVQPDADDVVSVLAEWLGIDSAVARRACGLEISE